MPGTLRSRLLRVLTIIGGTTTALLVLLAMVMTWTCVTRDEVPSQTVLELHLDRPLADAGAENPLEAVLGDRPMTLLEVVQALERATHDERVVGLVAYVDGTPHGPARVEELRDAILAFRAAGKPAVAFSETFGELSSGNQGYYLATAFDEIVLQPSGAVGLTGLRSEHMFLRGALDKLEVEPNGDRRREYKGAYDHYAGRRLSEAGREQTAALLADLHAQLVAAIAPRLGDDKARAQAVIEQGPFLAPQALELGLVDALGYRDEARARLEARIEGPTERLYPQPYLERAGGPWDEGEVIAIIHGVGLITRGPSAFDPIGGQSSMGSDTITAAFAAAIDDPQVQAIVFRVDSGGGSAVASDAIWRATQRARDAGKPVIVTMGNVAASGGYYVAAGATTIVAQPSTVTGSIGVVAGKPVATRLWNKLGITWDSVQTSPNAAFFSSLERYDERGWEQLQDWLDNTYDDFKQRVAQGRGLSPEEVEALARGRIWSGTQAKARGLVDVLGGMPQAIALAREEAGIDKDAPLELRAFPRSQGLLDRLLGDNPDNSDHEAARVRVEAGLDRWRQLAARLRAAQMVSGEAGALVAEPVELR